MRKKLLIILGSLLVIVVFSLIYYTYQSIPSLSESEPVSTLSTPQPTSTPTEEELKLEQIKKSVGGINNETFTISENSVDCEDQDPEYQKRNEEFTQEVIEGVFKISEGTVLEINNSQLKINFHQGSYEWISNVTTTPTTKYEFITSTGETTPASFNDIQTNNRVIVKSQDNKVIDSDFTAEVVYVFGE
jgi:hypothetical protein